MPDRRVTDIVDARESLNRIVAEQSADKLVVFGPVFVREPNMYNPAHAFYTTVSWLYIHYLEAGRKALPFLEERADSLGVNGGHGIDKHRTIVHCWRTVLQHNLDPAKRDDAAKLLTCDNWMIGTVSESDEIMRWPTNSEQWEKLLDKILAEAKQYLRVCRDVVEQMIHDTGWRDTLSIWIHRVERQLDAWEWEDLLRSVISDMGLSNFPVKRFRDSCLAGWNNDLRNWSEGNDVLRIARSVVERSLLKSPKRLLPLNGSDVIEHLGISPGPRVGNILQRAQDLFDSGVSQRESLIELLKSEFSDTM